MILPQELEVFYVIPAIRRELAVNLLRMGLKQRQIAGIFGVTEACVSNYFKSKRASKVVFNDKQKKLLSDYAVKLKSNNDCFINVIHNLCNVFRQDRSLCQLHKELDDSVIMCGGCLS